MGAPHLRRRDGSVARAPVVATLGDGRRVYALAEESLLPELANLNLVGRKVSVKGSPATYFL